MKTFHLLVCLSSHGYGHFAMTAPILNALQKTHPIRLTIKTTLPEALLRTRIDGDFTVVAETSDFGMVMHDSFDVDIPKSADAYRSFHQDYDQKVKAEAATLCALKPDLVLANIPYLTIDAAFLSDIPCVAYCSLNWLEIFSHYFQNTLEEKQAIKSQITNAYNRADVCLCPAPSMPMPSLKNVKCIGPVAEVNVKKVDLRKAISHLFPVTPQTKIVIISPGGVSTHIPVADWPKEKNIIWLCSWPIKTSRRDIVSTADIDLTFNEILANCDAVISKPGYGMVSESTCNQVPALYVERGDWPEESHLVKWWQENNIVAEISRDQLQTGDVIQALNSLWAAHQPNKNKKSKILPTGIDDACNIISRYIQSRTSG